ncbi:CBBY-like protein [Humulus lupulus]|uniref:CBBY-like protein n=1 Tax=Humulus lupulus TaxID=3486 RepID=UPI002B407A20|nr:CBBY-like protein [Humulus lupulus]XP_062096612.1 CBBY-like protein [Humulus lupulus]XP_062096613.1 CBBY-like protein [Humulus lupulus]
MESPSPSSACSIPKTTNRFAIPTTSSTLYTAHFSSLSTNPLTLLPPFRFTFPGKSYFPRKCLELNYFTAFSSLSRQDYLNDDQNPSQEFAVLLEVEGVLVDAYRVGNRQAFNTAFQKLGLDCANWSEPVYLDLVRKSVGDEEKMLNLFFNRIGWPTSLPTSEKGSFIKSVLREKGNALNEFLVSNSLPLRPGVEEFIDNAYNEGVPVVILTAYCKNADKIARSIAEKLGNERVSKVKIIGNEEVEQSTYSRLVHSKQFSSGLDEEIAKEAKKAVSAEKQRIAEKVASTLKVSVDIDTSPSESIEKIITALRAGAESAGVPVYNCVLVAGSQSGVAAAERVAMPCIVLRSSLTSRAEFPSAKAVMDGFGGADLTIFKLRQKTQG